MDNCHMPDPEHHSDPATLYKRCEFTKWIPNPSVLYFAPSSALVENPMPSSWKNATSSACNTFQRWGPAERFYLASVDLWKFLFSVWTWHFKGKHGRLNSLQPLCTWCSCHSSNPPLVLLSKLLRESLAAYTCSCHKARPVRPRCFCPFPETMR